MNIFGIDLPSSVCITAPYIHAPYQPMLNTINVYAQKAHHTAKWLEVSYPSIKRPKHAQSNPNGCILKLHFQPV